MREVQIAEPDYKWLKSFIENWVVKCHSNVSAYVEYVEMFDRLAENFSAAKTIESDQDRLFEEEPKQKKKALPYLAPKICADHPTYGAKRKPRTSCTTCWAAYKKLNIAKVVQKR